MNGDHRGSRVFHAQREIQGCFLTHAVTAAEFAGDRLCGALRYRPQDRLSPLRIQHQCRAFSVFDDLRGRAAHIDVNQQNLRPIFKRCGDFSQDVRIAAEQLDRNGRLIGGQPQQLPGVLVLIVQCLGTDHLGKGQIRTLFCQDAPKRPVRYPGQRSHQHGSDLDRFIQLDQWISSFWGFYNQRAAG
ncbi:hypothetical protein SDC9_192963 [bioreactor metagenome]|uniref:Uncharacterized protein n=1 Tax=bioreactor metagenome TaxID=1076179 RepID=A0A645I3E8_9ZZZZ